MDIPADSVPAELKPVCEQILRRARELRKADPVMSYWCCFSAASASMRLPGKRSHEANKFLMNLLDVLEQMKSSLVDPTSGVEHSTITDEAAGSAYVENFAMKVFLQADDEDRAGKASKATIRKFVVAAQFMEVLRCFEAPNGMRDELEQKQQYARWKAADIAKALKEGRTPTPGPPAGEENVGTDGEEPAASTSGTAASPPSTFPSLPDAPSSPKSEAQAAQLPPPPPPARQDSTQSGTWITVATPGVKDSDDPEDAFHIPSVPTTTDEPRNRRPSAGGLKQERPEGYEKKGVRFAGPDGAPLSPSATVVTLDSYIAPDAPPSSAFEEPEDTQSKEGSPRGSPLSGDTPETSEEPPTIHLPSTPAFVPASQSTLPSAPTTPARPQPAPSAPVEPHYPDSLDSKSIEKCQKHARWAISALDYEDLETARKELRQALALLEGR
ncbi:hypothetical protein NCC49_001909 [Naganishia albida]|nr:hypothetical protein NCC49_001909 [Naganishia albida]